MRSPISFVRRATARTRTTSFCERLQPHYAGAMMDSRGTRGHRTGRAGHRQHARQGAPGNRASDSRRAWPLTRARPRDQQPRARRTAAAHRAQVRRPSSGCHSRHRGDPGRPRRGAERGCAGGAGPPSGRAAGSRRCGRRAHHGGHAARGSRVACPGHAGSHAHPSQRRLQPGARDHISRALGWREGGRGSARGARRRARRHRRAHAQDRGGVLPHVRRCPARRSGSGSHVSAGSRGPHRRIRAPAGGHPAQRRRASSRHLCRGGARRIDPPWRRRVVTRRRGRRRAPLGWPRTGPDRPDNSRLARADSVHVRQHRRSEGRSALSRQHPGEHPRDWPGD